MENCEDHARSNLAQNSNAPRSQEDYITQNFEEVERTVAKNLSREFSRTVNLILGALSRLDNFLMNPLIQGYSGTAPETSRKPFDSNQESNEDDAQSDSHPASSLLQSQATQISDLEDGDDIMTGVHEEVTFCSHSTSSGKQKKKRSSSQPQFCSKTTTATNEEDQSLLALQNLANNNNSAIFHNNINRISKLPVALTKTMPKIDGKSGKLELFEDFFPTRLKIFYQLIQDDRINYFNSFIRRDALQTFKNFNGPTRENLGETLAVVSRKYVKPQSMATTKQKFQKLSSI